MLVERLPHAESVGLSKRNSRVYFEAVELRDLLAADETIAASMARDDDDDSIDVNEPRSPLRGYSDSEMNLPPPITREKTQDAMDRLGSALDVFVEDVCTAVPSKTSLAQAFLWPLVTRPPRSLWPTSLSYTMAAMSK